MIVLDTDHITELQFEKSNRAQRLSERLYDSQEPTATTIITVEEQMRGWLARIARTRNPQKQIQTYARLQAMIAFFADWSVLPWDQESIDAFTRLTAAKLKVGTQDLKIAAIAIANGGVLLSRNLRDFERVPGLTVENWID